jgi:uncharacterized protein YbjQ (UPF0145 family)
MRTLAVVFAIAVVGCATGRRESLPQPRDVRFTNSRDVVKSCTMLGLIDSSDKTNGGVVTQMPAERNALRRLRNEAARLEANTVLVNEAPPGMSQEHTRDGTLMQGEAYRCARDAQS